MELSHVVEMLGVHAEGEIGKVIVSGAPHVPGASMVEKMNYINTIDDSLIKRYLYEPRGAAQLTINLLVPPCRDGADMGFLPIQADGAHGMSGSNAMCVTTALLESRMMAPEGRNPIVRLDTPAGLVEAAATWTGSKVERVAVDMPVSFVEHLDHPLEVEGLGRISVDVAFGGCYFVLADAGALGFEIVPREARELVELGARIHHAAAEQISVRHPETPEFSRIEYPMFVAEGDGDIRNATVIFPGRLDRSPCGTGTAARLAVMRERGRLGVNDEIDARSIVGGRFVARILGDAMCGDRAAVRTNVSGRAWIYGRHTLGAHPSDPFQLGYTLSDTWGSGQLHARRRPEDAGDELR